MMRTLLFAFAISLGAGCTVVDTSDLDPIDDYTTWFSIETSGKLPGHGDTVRVMYINDTARSYPHTGEYPLGSVIVKEVRENDDGNPGPLNYLAIMRRLDEAPPSGTLEGGWLFTRSSELGADEIQGFTCWKKCHVQAPYVGTWFDYGL
jgi:hypothetical protein